MTLSAFLRHPVFVLLAAASALVPRSAAAIDPSYSGSWYRPAESGSGFNLEIFSSTRALLYWYTYDDFGDPVWLYSEGIITGERIDFTVYYAEGMVFRNPQAGDKVNRVWGTLRMDFLGCNAATVTYGSTLTGIRHSPVGSRTLPVERLVGIDSLPCRRPAAGYWVGQHYDPTLDNGRGGFADLRGVLTEDGRLFFNSEATDEMFIGTYAATDADDVGFQYRVCGEDGSRCLDATATAQFANKDFIDGQSTVSGSTRPIELAYRTLYDRKLTFFSLVGTYTRQEGGITYTFTVAGDGRVNGTSSNGCIYTGQLQHPNPLFNLFNYVGTMSGCRIDNWTGVVVNTDEVPGDAARLEFRLQTRSSPISFVVTR